MDAVKFLKEDERMCHTIADCATCPLSENNNKIRQCCSIFKQEHPKEYVEIVEKWSKKHPRKTLLDDFKEKYPNANWNINDCPRFCPYDVYTFRFKPKCKLNCKKCKEDGVFSSECWNTPLEDIK